MSDYVQSKETITIDKVTQYGGKVNGKSYNLSKKYTGPTFEVGKTYDVQVSTSPSGAKYVNGAKEIQVLNLPAQTTETVSTSYDTRTAGGLKPEWKYPDPIRANGSSLSPSEKDSRILVQGILQAVIQSPYIASVADKDAFIVEAKSLTVSLVEFVRNFK